MKNAPRFPSRWAGLAPALLLAVAVSAALSACASVDGVLYGAREGTIEYPGSGAGPNAAAVYVVKEKDTVDGIAQRFGVATQTIVDRNKLQPPYPLKPGQQLELPGAKYVAAAVPTQTTSPSPGSPVKKESLAPPGQSEPVPLTPSTQQQVTVPATPPPRFEWPLQGKVVAGYGPRADGQKNDGIDIQAEKGAPVKAADSGTVVYSGNEVRGMGNLLLVSHAGGYITAYAYNDSLLAKKGDTVNKGQVIARVGATGNTTEPRLHFEIRRANRTVDPVTLLPAQ